MYQKTDTKPQGRAAFRKACDAVKDAVPLETYAAEHVELRQAGSDRLVGRCPLHQENTPSFYVYPDGHYHCYGCQAHGDVIDLCQAFEGGEPWEAMMTLAARYGVEIPGRSERWHQRQDEKHEDWNRVVGVLLAAYQRRLFRIFAPVILDGIGSPAEREEEAERLWGGFGRVAWHMARRRTEK